MMACATKTLLIIALFLVFSVVQGDGGQVPTPSTVDSSRSTTPGAAGPISTTAKVDATTSKPGLEHDKKIGEVCENDKECGTTGAQCITDTATDKKKCSCTGTLKYREDTDECAEDETEEVPSEDQKYGEVCENDKECGTTGAKCIADTETDKKCSCTGTLKYREDTDKCAEDQTEEVTDEVPFPCTETTSYCACEDSICRCSNDQKCGIGSLCRDEKCYCPIGYDNTLKACYVGHGDICYDPIQCSKVNNGTCKEGHCVCNGTMEYDPIKKICSGNLEVGKQCGIKEECKYSVCQNYTCACPQRTTYCKETNQCGIELHGQCKVGDQCLTTDAICDDQQKCACPAGMRAGGGCNDTCKGEKKFGEVCENDKECRTTGAKCITDTETNEKKCSCAGTLKYREDTDECAEVGVGDKCPKEDEICAHGAKCKNGTCTCDEGRKEKNKLCALKRLEDCTENDTCFDDGAVCGSSKKCECGKYLTYHNNKCEGVQKIGEECEQNSQCQTKGAVCDSDKKCNCSGTQTYKNDACEETGIDSTTSLLGLLTTKLSTTTAEEQSGSEEEQPTDTSKPSTGAEEQSGGGAESPKDTSKPSTGGKKTDGTAKTVQGEDAPSSGHNIIAYIVVLLVLVVAGYIIYQNKQKILGMILEGRQGQERKGRVRYRKLTTEDVMPTTEDKSAMKGYVF